MKKINTPKLSEDGKTVIKCDSGFEGAVEIPEGVTTIEEFAFYGCDLITSVKIPSSVTKIGRSAFEGCTRLTSIEIQNKATKIANDAFEDCNNLKLPENWKKYPIESTAYLGFGHCGDVTADGEGFVILSDEDVKQLVALIQENEGETDVEVLDLKNKLPEIYELLDKACYDSADKASYKHILIEGFEDMDLSLNEETIDELEDEIDFDFKVDPDDYRDKDGNLDPDYFDEDGDEIPEAFEDERRTQLINRIYDYAEGLDTNKLVEFIENYYDLMDVNFDFNGDYSVKIPKEIIKMAKSE